MKKKIEETKSDQSDNVNKSEIENVKIDEHSKFKKDEKHPDNKNVDDQQHCGYETIEQKGTIKRGLYQASIF